MAFAMPSCWGSPTRRLLIGAARVGAGVTPPHAPSPPCLGCCRWWAEYVHFEPDKQWAYHSVLLPRQLHADHPGEVLVLSDKAFFYPLWTQLTAMYDRDDG